jgi:predicted transcriptional regulator
MIMSNRGRLTAAEKKKIIDLYVNSKLSMRGIADQMACSYGTVNRVLQDAEGVQVRARGGHRRGDKSTSGSPTG